MTSAHLKLQNAEVFVNLVGKHSMARPGDTSKYFTSMAGGSSERVYVDGCTADSTKLFSGCGLQDYVRHAVEGGTSALFLSGAGITRLSDYDRKKFMAEFCRSIGKSMAEVDPDLSMTYAFVGLTDSKVIDFHRDRNVSLDKIPYGLADLQHEVDDWEVTEEKILKGSTIPFILSLHFESLKDAPTNGHLCLVDLNIADWSPNGSPAGEQGCSKAASLQKLQQSTRSLSSLVHLLANDVVLTGATIPSNTLIDLVGDFLYGEGKTAFVIHLNADEEACADIGATVDLIKSLRKLKTRETIRAVDRRVVFFYEKAKYYQSEKYRFQDELTDAQEERESLEKDLDDIQRDFSEERESLVKEISHWQNRSQTLEQTLEAMKSESEGMEADARWENAKLVTERLALKDEIRRAEIEMSASENEKTRLLDLYESLQESYSGLDVLHKELLGAYRVLKDRFGNLADENTDLKQRADELDTLLHQKSQCIDELTANIKSNSLEHDRFVEDLESRHAGESEELETQLCFATQKTKELSAKVAQLETEIKSLSVSQTAEVSSLQSTIKDLSSQLEEAQRQAASDNAELSSKVRLAEKATRKLEAEKAKLVDRVDELLIDKEDQSALSAQTAAWKKEHEQLQRQIKRLQQTAAHAERREAELREESETQWTAWEEEKERNHQKYLKLKDKFRQAVEYAADVQVMLDDERQQGTPPSQPLAADSVVTELAQPPQQAVPAPAVDESGSTSKSTTTSKRKPQKPARRKAQPKKTSLAKSVSFADTDEASKSASDGGDAEPVPKSSSSSVTARRATRGRGMRTSYVDSDNEDQSDDGCSALHAQKSAPAQTTRSSLHQEPPVADAASHSDGGESDDSEISFKPPHPAEPQAQRASRRASLRTRRSVEELDAELRTMPARRKRTAAPGASDEVLLVEADAPRKPSTGSNRSRRRKGRVDAEEAADPPEQQQQQQQPAEPTKKPSPKRKRALAASARRPKNSAASESNTPSTVEVPAAAPAEEPLAAAKKKRKLNLSRMRSLLGITAGKQAAAQNPQAVKFSVPMIRPAPGASKSKPAFSAARIQAGTSDSDESD